MPRYHFHIGDGEFVQDQVGREMADINAAGVEAVRLLGEVLAGRPEKLWRESMLSVFVADSSGLTLFSVDATLSCAPAISALRAN